MPSKEEGAALVKKLSQELVDVHEKIYQELIEFHKKDCNYKDVDGEICAQAWAEEGMIIVANMFSYKIRKKQIEESNLN